MFARKTNRPIPASQKIVVVAGVAIEISGNNWHPLSGGAVRQIACKVMNLIKVYLCLEQVLFLPFSFNSCTIDFKIYLYTR